MLLMIEGYPYNLDHKVRENLTVKDILQGVISISELEKKYSPEYVGYCYNKKINDVIFFLPKVVLTGEKTTEAEAEKANSLDTIFGASPEEIIDFDSDDIKDKFTEEGCKNYKEFLSSLSIWIYRTISVYKKSHNDNILESREHQTESRGKKHKHNTLLDVIIALRDFNKDNQDYFTFITKNIHSGLNKIHWNKTISHTQAIIQDGSPVYINPINRKKVVNFDEELLVIYFSILNYIKQTHGFDFEINLNYDLISPDKLKLSYIDKNLGCRRLKQIKYKYFSDKALRIWDLCYAFFDREYKIAMNQINRDFLLAKDFEHIFEVMIDTLIGETNLPKDLKEQKDGKMVDHMFIGQSLIEQSDFEKELTYYIGDSKYYKRVKDGVKLGTESIYKQYTYAKNVVQWNMDLFLNEKDEEKEGQPQLRDELTEGYNPIPNFFISARIPSKQKSTGKFLNFDDYELHTQEENVSFNRQFENRLFDRDTLLLCHYDVNFLFIVSLYGRDNKNRQAKWRDYIRNEFRTKIQSTLNRLYTFRIIQPRKGLDCYQFIKDNFHLLNGKIYRPRQNSNYLVLALMKTEEDNLTKIFRSKARENEVTANENILDILKSHFQIGDPFVLKEVFDKPDSTNVGSLEKQQFADNEGVILVMMENYATKSAKFIDSGKIAVPIRYTNDGMEILSNSANIKKVLFHTRHASGQHLYTLKESIRFVPKDQIPDGYYLTVQNPSPPNPEEQVVYLYALLEIDMANEIDSSMLNCQNKPFASQKERYDAQYADILTLII